MMNFDNLLVVDTETVPCLDTAKRLLGLASDIPDNEVTLRLQEHCMRRSTDDASSVFIKSNLQKIVCLSALSASKDAQGIYRFKRLGTGHVGAFSERKILARFNAVLDASPNPTLVTFHGKSFDVPVIRTRALALGVAMPALRRNNKRDYLYRFGEDHFDLCDVMSSFGAAHKPSLLELCAVCNIPCKHTEANGSNISAMMAEGRVLDVAAYCETDVVSLYLLMLRNLLVMDLLPQDAYLASVADFKEAMTNDGRAHLAPYASMPALSFDDEPAAAKPVEEPPKDAAPAQPSGWDSGTKAVHKPAEPKVERQSASWDSGPPV